MVKRKEEHHYKEYFEDGGGFKKRNNYSAMKEIKKCYNCKFAGEQFKIVGKTHLHCHNEEKFPKEDFESGKICAWDTLMEFWNTCDKHEKK